MEETSLRWIRARRLEALLFVFFFAGQRDRALL